MTKWKYDDALLRVPSLNDGSKIAVGRNVPKAIILERIGRASMRIFHAAYCMVAYLERGEKHFIALGFGDEREARALKLPEGIGLLGQLWAEGAGTIRLDDIAKYRKSSGCPYGHPVLEAFLGTPICFDHQTLGVIYLSKRPGDTPFVADDESTLEVLASACAIELSNAQTFDRLKDAYVALETRTEELNQANRQLQVHELELEGRTKDLDRVNKQLKIHAIDLELLNEELIAANTAKDQFLANTSHELRTPLNAIIGFSDLLTDVRLGQLSDKQKRYVNHINVSGKRLLSIINALLDISKIESGMMEIHESACNPVEIGEQLMSELQPLAESKRVQLVLTESLASDLCVHTDKDKVHQVLMNLLGNALKFTAEEGRVELNMSISKTANEEYYFCCSVTDNGIGIATDDQAKIFSPFIQASSGMDRTHGGTGLGLSLAKHMIELLGGSICVESAVGEGSVFSIELPVRVSQAEALANHHMPVQQMAVDALVEVKEVLPDVMRQPVIMIVDENRPRASAAQRMFEGEGYRVVLTDMHGVDGVVASCNPLLIMLGVPDGADTIYDQLQRLKRLDIANKTPTILLGGDAQELKVTTGATIGQIQHGLDRQDLLEMVSHFDMHAPKPPSAPVVLVVDDEASVREYLKETLVAEGYHVLLAGDGDEGYRMAVDKDPNLIILDLMMPGTSGFDVIQRLKNHPSACDIPVVIFTAKDLSRSEALLLGQDVERVLVKGVSSRGDVLQQLHKLELLYPVRAKLMDTKLDCFNARYIQRRLEHEISRTLRYRHSFFALVWEMDGFESYCEKHGKRWGLAALKSSVSILHSILRKGDVLARLDSNRLILLLPGLSVRESHFVAEKIRLRIGRQRLPLPNSACGTMTVSIGGVASGECEESKAMIALLQQRLEMAIAEGGNRMILEDV